MTAMFNSRAIVGENKGVIAWFASCLLMVKENELWLLEMLGSDSDMKRVESLSAARHSSVFAREQIGDSIWYAGVDLEKRLGKIVLMIFQTRNVFVCGSERARVLQICFD